MGEQPRPVPRGVIDLVDTYIDTELDQAQRYDNRTPLDNSGRWSLHELAAELYGRGWHDAAFVIEARTRREETRLRDQVKAQLEAQLAEATEPDLDLEWVEDVKAKAMRLLTALDEHPIGDPALSVAAKALAERIGWSG